MAVLAHQRPAQPVSALIQQVLTKLGKERVMLLDEVRQAWPDIVGPDVAANTRPVAVRGDTLCVEVANAAWLYVLQNERSGEVTMNVRKFTTGRLDAVRMVPVGAYGRP